MPFKFIALLFLISTCFADSPAPQKDYCINSPNGEYVMVIFHDEKWKDYAVEDEALRKQYKVAGIYTKGGVLISIIQNHMWGAIVTDYGVGFGLGQWASRGNFDEIGYYICKNNETIGIKVQDFIVDTDKLPTSVSHYESIFMLRYHPDMTAVVIVTMESKAIVYNAKNGEIGDLKNHFRW